MAPNERKILRCAIYTRKSSEHGLEQDFNSLDAQREAAEAYIKSQAHEGWKLVKTHYDDGGLSGGTLERPALQSLLADIRARKIDVVVVYKVDRLTRSLADFAKLVELFEAHGVSFVSVTQQFNTTTSMGRLTLNVLLSFAQFEREVAGERIRDKFAASRRKGMWMGGTIPLGYDVKDRKLVVNEAEAETVRLIFRRYLRARVRFKLSAELDRKKGIRSKQRILTSGRVLGGCTFGRGALYHLLRNRIYRGEVVHKGIAYPGEHEAIVAEELWNAVQAKLSGNILRQRQNRVESSVWRRCRSRSSPAPKPLRRLSSESGISWSTRRPRSWSPSPAGAVPCNARRPQQRTRDWIVHRYGSRRSPYRYRPDSGQVSPAGARPRSLQDSPASAEEKTWSAFPARPALHTASP